MSRLGRREFIKGALVGLSLAGCSAGGSGALAGGGDTADTKADGRDPDSPRFSGYTGAFKTIAYTRSPQPDVYPWMPCRWHDTNANWKHINTLHEILVDHAIHYARRRYENPVPAVLTPDEPRATYSLPMVGGTIEPDERGFFNARDEDGPRSVVEMALVADGFYDTQYANLFNTLNTYEDGLWVRRIIFRLAREMNGPWSPDYWGWDSALGVGGSRREKMLSLAAGTGRAGVVSLIETVASSNTGDRGPVWKAAWERVVGIALNINQNIVVSLNTGTPSADFTGGSQAARLGYDPGHYSKNYNKTAIPRPEYWSIADLDFYCANQQKHLPAIESIYRFHKSFRDTYGPGKPLGSSEWGFRLNENGPESTNVACSDSQAAAYVYFMRDWINANEYTHHQFWNNQSKTTGEVHRPIPGVHVQTIAALEDVYTG